MGAEQQLEESDEQVREALNAHWHASAHEAKRSLNPEQKPASRPRPPVTRDMRLA